MNNFSEKSNFIWSIVDLIRGPYRPNQYGRVILPLTVIRRLDCVLEPTKGQVLKKLEELESRATNAVFIKRASIPTKKTRLGLFCRGCASG